MHAEQWHRHTKQLAEPLAPRRRSAQEYSTPPGPECGHWAECSLGAMVALCSVLLCCRWRHAWQDSMVGAKYDRSCAVQLQRAGGNDRSGMPAAMF